MCEVIKEQKDAQITGFSIGNDGVYVKKSGGTYKKTGNFVNGVLDGKCSVVDDNLQMKIEGFVNRSGEKEEDLITGVVTYQNVPTQRFVERVKLNFPFSGKL